MGSMACKLTAAYLDTQDFKYSVLGDNDEVIRANFSMDNKDGMTILVFFDSDDESASLKSFNFVKFPEAKKEKMYKVCNDLNKQYRWVSFYVDDEDNTITIQSDAIIQMDSCGPEILELMAKMSGIGDDAYPVIMKAIYA